MTQQTPSQVRGWTVVLTAVSINLILGVLYAWSVMGKALVLQWHWKAAQASLPSGYKASHFSIHLGHPGGIFLVLANMLDHLLLAPEPGLAPDGPSADIPRRIASSSSARSKNRCSCSSGT